MKNLTVLFCVTIAARRFFKDTVSIQGERHSGDSKA